MANVNQLVSGLILVETDISADTTLTLTNIVGVYGGVQNGVGTVTLTLPAVSLCKGREVRVYLKTAAAHDLAVVSADASSLNGVIINAATGVLVKSKAGTTITFVGGTSVTGDFVTLYSDGAYWQMLGVCSVNGGITLS